MTKRQKTVRLRTVIISVFSMVAVVGVIFQGILMLMVVPSGSMEPTINAGDLLVGVRNPEEINRGDALAFQAQGTIMIKRVIGLPGEFICIQEDGNVTIDGEPLDEPYVFHQREGRVQEFYVPDGFILFFGDNRAGSFDARYWDDPYVSLESILAKAEYIIFPRLRKI